MKLAKWADSSSDERHAEFRNSANSNYPYRTLIKPMMYSKPIPVSEINRMKGVKIPSCYVESEASIANAAQSCSTVEIESVVVQQQ